MEMIDVIRRKAGDHSLIVEATEMTEWPHGHETWEHGGIVYRRRAASVTTQWWEHDVVQFAPELVAAISDDDLVGFDLVGSVEDLTAELPEPTPPPPPWQVAGGRELEPARRTLLAAGCTLVHADDRWVVLMPSDVGIRRASVLQAARLVHEAGSEIGHLELDQSWGDRILLAPGLVVRPEIADLESASVGSVG